MTNLPNKLKAVQIENPESWAVYTNMVDCLLVQDILLSAIFTRLFDNKEREKGKIAFLLGDFRKSGFCSRNLINLRVCSSLNLLSSSAIVVLAQTMCAMCAILSRKFQLNRIFSCNYSPVASPVQRWPHVQL